MSFETFVKSFVKIFPVPKKLSFGFVGLDISKNSVRALQIGDSKFGKIPKKYKEYMFNESCNISESEQESDCLELIGILKKIKTDFQVDYVNISIPEIQTYIYKAKIPITAGKNIADTLLFSIDENVPLKPEEALLDYFVVGVNNDEIEAIVTVVPKELINRYTRILEKANLKPISFEPETHAISRGIIKKGDKGEYLLLNLNKNLPSVAVVSKELVQYTQTLPIVDYEFNEENQKILREQINKVIIYWATSIYRENFDKIHTLYLVGDMAYSTDLKNFLEKNLPLNVKFANVWSNCFDLNEYLPAISAMESLKYATAVGLALKKIK